MVSYQAWVSIYFETVERRGASIDDIDDGSVVMELAADGWHRFTPALKTATKARARDAAERHLNQQR